MTKDFIILDSDNEALFDAMSEHFTAKVKPLCGGGNYWKVELLTGEGETSDYFNAAIYDTREEAQSEIKRLYKVLKKFKRGKLKGVDAFKFADSEISALELLNLFELHSELDTANLKAISRMSAVEDCICKVENFLDKLRLETLMKGRCLA